MKNPGKSIIAACIALVAGGLGQQADACTRFVYRGAGNEVITGRSMDYKVDTGTHLWMFPRGMQRTGEAGANSLRWTSRYGSVIASAYDIATTDGMNEAGLVANLLWLAESEYPDRDSGKPGLSISAWTQYMLDNFASVDEAVKALADEPFTLITDSPPGEQRLATLHLSLSDASGDSAIIEYIKGKQVIHHGRDYQVMTNSPIFEEQLALNEYWRAIGGTVMLPGTNRAADRFARASFYVNAIPKSADPVESVASAFGVIRNVSVPYGITTPDQPNIASTRWRSVADQTRRLYFFESALAPNVFWVDLKKIDFSPETGRTRRLDLGQYQRTIHSGEANAQFEETAPFRFLGV
ncbi:linear amide C-N hydrolase [Stenotrophomonas sp. NLF4-10]|uniref:linear amide C-N hydrolase n=1 Tax=Stenotrophomonas sp. NLF4-10 TaxID=2918754 RepID=UPI001EFB7527|nr:linear amide C-N hydrolase [Stenotrophomonas sp. NLF4-10]MCG8275686.1 linear amide C-N hydrolase [Stenotrophomonas sp. NLF4-10]